MASVSYYIIQIVTHNNNYFYDCLFIAGTRRGEVSTHSVFKPNVQIVEVRLVAIYVIHTKHNLIANAIN